MTQKAIDPYNQSLYTLGDSLQGEGSGFLDGPVTTVNFWTHGIAMHQYAANGVDIAQDGRGLVAGDIVLLAHGVYGSPNLSTLSQPNNYGNPWNYLGAVQNPKIPGTLRLWWKVVTAAETAVEVKYTITSQQAFAQDFIGWRIPYGYADPTKAPIIRFATGDRYPVQHPAVPLPSDYPKSNSRLYTATVCGLTCYPFDNASDLGYNDNRRPDRSGWYRASSAGPTGLIGWTYGRLGSGRAIPASGPPLTNDSATNVQAPYGTPIDWMGATLVFLPVTLPLPTTTIENIVDTYEGPTTVDPGKAITSGPVSVNSSKQAVLGQNASIYYNGQFSLSKKSIVLEMVQATTPAVGDYVQFLLGARDGGPMNTVYMAVTRTNTPSGITGPFLELVSTDAATVINYIGGRLVYNATDMRWWRIREDTGAIYWDVAPTSSGPWKTRFESEHNWLLDQLDNMSVIIRTTGGATAVVDNLGITVPEPTWTVPKQTSYDWMEVPLNLQDTWHGRDAIVADLDQGTTAAVRNFHNLNLVARRNFEITANPFDYEIYAGQTHGCLTCSDAVPPFGKVMDGLITGTPYVSDTVIAQAMVWAIRGGANIINLSFGGGYPSQAMYDAMAYLSGFDVAMFVSAGNENLYQLDSPSAFSDFITNVHSVGAFDEVTGARAVFSNHSDTMSGVTPGEYVAGLTPSAYRVLWRGTSASAPHASNICARLLTGIKQKKLSPVAVAQAMDRHTRDTGQPRSEQGNGAYSLVKAAPYLTDPISGNLPAVAMPRFFDGQWADVPEGFNQMAREVERKGSVVRVRRTSPYAVLPNNLHAHIPWEECEIDNPGGQWDANYPHFLFIQDDGLYQVVCLVRFGTTFANGYCSATILVNGYEAKVNGVATDRKPGFGTATAANEGNTIDLVTEIPLYAGDFVLVEVYQTSGSNLNCVDTTFCGTYLSVSRIAPLAPQLVSGAGPVTAASATTPNFHTATVSWTNPAQADLDAVVIRRALAGQPMSVVSDGVYVSTVPVTPGGEPDAINGCPNPSGAGGVTGWSSLAASGAAPTPVQVTGLTSPWERSTAVRATCPSSPGAYFQIVSAAYIPGGDLSGQPMSSTARWMCSAVPSGTTYLILVALDGNGSYLGNINYSTLTPTAGTSGVTPLTGTAPSGTRRVAVALQAGNPAAGLVLTLGSVRIAPVADANLAYLDGDSPNWAWTGTAGASASNSTTLASRSSYSDASLAGNTGYTYGLFARAAGVYSPVTQVPVLTPLTPPPPAPITNLTSNDVRGTSIKLTWTNPSGGGFAGTMLRKAVGSTPPASPAEGLYVADLAANVSSYTDTGLAERQDYAYAAFSHTADPSYAQGAFAVFTTTYELTGFGTAAPTITSVKTDGPISVGLSFYITKPARAAGLRFYRSSTAIAGTIQGRITGVYGAAPPVVGTDVTFTLNGTGWQTAMFDTPVELDINYTYMVVLYYPGSYPETTPYWGGTGPGVNGKTTDLVTFPAQRETSTNLPFAQCASVKGSGIQTPAYNPSAGPTAGGPMWWPDVYLIADP